MKADLSKAHDTLGRHIQAQTFEPVADDPFTPAPEPRCPTCNGTLFAGECLGACTRLAVTRLCECGKLFETKTKDVMCPACSGQDDAAWRATTPRREMDATSRTSRAARSWSARR